MLCALLLCVWLIKLNKPLIICLATRAVGSKVYLKMWFISFVGWKQSHYQMLIQHGCDELEVSWMKVIKGRLLLTEKERWVNLGSDLYYLTVAWSFDVGSSGCSNPPLSVSNKAFTRNRVANILQSTFNHCTVGFLCWYPILSWLTQP